MKEAWQKTQEEHWNDFVDSRPKDWNGEPSMPSRPSNYKYIITRVDADHKRKVKQAVLNGLPVPKNIQKEYKL